MARGVALAVAVVVLATAGRASAGPHRLTSGVQVGGGYDSNVLLTPDDERGAPAGELEGKIRHTYSLSPRTQWRNGVAFGTSYRNGSDVEATRITAEARTALRRRVTGARPQKRKFVPSAFMQLEFHYAGAFTPTLRDKRASGENVEVIGDEEESEDFQEDEEIVDEEDNAAAGAGLYDDDAGEEAPLEGETDPELEEGAADEFFADEDSGDAFFEESPARGAFFNNRPPRHIYSFIGTFDGSPWRRTSAALNLRADIADIGETRGQESSDYVAWGIGAEAAYTLTRRLRLSFGLNHDVRRFDDRVVAIEGTGEAAEYAIRGTSISLGATYLALKALRLSGDYKYGFREVDDADRLDSNLHQIRLGLQYRLWKSVYLYEDNVFLTTGLRRGGGDARRIQAIVGLRYVIG